ncbi:MAG: Xaa-Pro peptidase family protein [Planctomycetota bacterium]
MNSPNYIARRGKLRDGLGECDSLLVTCENNVRYLTGFTGDSSYLLISSGGDENALLISDPRYDEQIQRQCPGLETHIRAPSEVLDTIAAEQINGRNLKRTGFESQHVTYDLYQRLKEACACELAPTSQAVESLRMIKDDSEIAILEQAVEIAQNAFVAMKSQLKADDCERDLAFSIESRIRALGGEGCSFNPIVAVGANAALPHAEPGENQIYESPLLLVDWGATVQGYRSDLTRLIFSGPTTGPGMAEIEDAYGAVLESQLAAIDMLGPGVQGSEVDAVVRDVLRRYGVEERFNHGLGHGIGLDIHESPRMGKNFPQPLQAGMVITVEPGVYFPGLGGIRIEDDVLVTKTGCRVLSSLPKDLDSSRISLGRAM